MSNVLDRLPLHCRKCKGVFPSRFHTVNDLMANVCRCVEACSCGWHPKPGKVCGNPATARCSSRIMYGKYNRKTKRYE